MVYKAEDIRLNRAVALKFLPPHLAPDAISIPAVRREAEAASAMEFQRFVDHRSVPGQLRLRKELDAEFESGKSSSNRG